MPDPIATERKTVHAMLKIYCRAHHGGAPICDSCAELQAYVDERLDKCPFGWEKPTCKNCRVHCYQKDRREQIRDVMRFSGPRMLLHHPILAVKHLLKGVKS
jgi:hypothetical protein